MLGVMESVKTTVRIPKDLHTRAKLVATQFETTLEKLVTEGLERAVSAAEEEKNR